ncbi:MAG: LapA family protein [Alphaproteobacteria bacterium]|nr:LapA family protein [Alphaproteobacteria bacterium]
MNFIKLIVGLPLVIIICVIAFMNNQTVTLNLWPFSFNITASLSVVIIFLVLLGYIIGKIGSWMTYAPVRMALRNQQRQNRKLNAEQQKLVEKVEGLKENLENIKASEPAAPKESGLDKLKQQFSGLFKRKPKQDDFWCL